MKFPAWLSFGFIDLYMRTRVVRVFRQCLEDEWKPLEYWRDWQRRRLAELMKHAATRTRYYRRLFRELGIEDASRVEPEHLTRLPILTKALIRQHFDDLVADNYREFAPRISRTSGSTGEPLTVYHTGLSHTYLRALNFAAWAQRGYRLGDPYVAFAGGSLLPDTLGFKQRVYAWLQNCHVVPSYHLSHDRFEHGLRELCRRRIPYLYGYASALYDLACQLEGSGWDFSFLRGIFTTADMLFPAQRKKIESIMGVSIIDIYGNPESGLMSYECERHDGFHYGMQNAYVEVVDEEGRTLPEGQVGRIIVTSLNNFSFPMLRYETGDEGAISTAPCSCGRGYARVIQLGGRSRDYVVLPDGRHIHGAFFNHLNSIYNADWLARYHIRQPSPKELIFECLCGRQPTEEEREAVAAEIRAGTQGLVSVRVEPVETLPMTRRGKYKLISREFEESRTP